ncbi:MAG: rod shape-determining protein MreD [Clostridia bacterium]|nr:rod shape-determining protein MreD [Clostridia bacterium]
MKKVLTYISLVLLVILGTSLGRYIEIFGVSPNPALCFVIIYSLTNGSVRSASLGLVCGLIFDSVSNVAFGFNGLILMYMCLISSYFSKRFYYHNKTALVFGVFMYSLFYETLSMLFTAVIFSDAPFFHTFFRFALVEASLNSIIAIPILFWVKWLNNEYIRGI